MSPRRARALADRVVHDHATALREHLVAIAQHLVGTVGVSSITTRQIAREAGVSEGVLYNYFGDKRDLIVAAIRHRYDRLVEAFDEGVPTPGSATVEANLLSLASAAQAMHDQLLPIIVGLLNEPDLLRRFMDEIHREPLGPQVRIRAYLSAERDLGRLAPDVDVDATTMLLMGAAFVSALGRHLMPSPPPVRSDDRMPDVVATLIKGLGLPVSRRES
jgi:AcrR family transcriptional regulator